MPLPLGTTIIVEVYHSPGSRPLKGNIGEATVDAVDTGYTAPVKEPAA